MRVERYQARNGLNSRSNARGFMESLPQVGLLAGRRWSANFFFRFGTGKRQHHHGFQTEVRIIRSIASAVKVWLVLNNRHRNHRNAIGECRHRMGSLMYCALFLQLGISIVQNCPDQLILGRGLSDYRLPPPMNSGAGQRPDASPCRVTWRLPTINPRFVLFS